MSEPLYTTQEIERAFTLLSKEVTARSKGNGTSCDDVLQFLYEHPEKIWWMSWELIGQVTKDGKFLSHRAPARASDLAIQSPHLVQDRKISRFACYRLRWENMELVQQRLKPKEAPPAVRQELPVEPVKCEHGLPKFVQCPDCKK